MIENIGFYIYLIDVYSNIMALAGTIIVLIGIAIAVIAFISMIDKEIKEKGYLKKFYWKTYVLVVVVVTLLPSSSKLPAIIFAEPVLKQIMESKTLNKVNELLDLYIEKERSGR